MENYSIKHSLCEKAKRYNEYILSINNKNVDDDIIKAYILENNLLHHHCKICQQMPYWNKRPLDLVLDRVNNNSRDNRLENLRLLCPNCLSQLKNRSTIFEKILNVNIQKCIECEKIIKKSGSNYKNRKNKSCNYRCKGCLEKAIFFPFIQEIDR